MDSYFVAISYTREFARASFENVPAISAIYSFIRDLVVLLYSLLSGKLRVGDLWLRGVNEDAIAPVKLDAETQVDRTIVTQAAQVIDDKNAWVNSTTVAKRYSPVSALCRAIVQRDVDLVSKMLTAAPRLASMKHSLGYYPLSVAVLSEEPALVRLILSQPGVNPECMTNGSYGDSDAHKELLRTEFSSNVNHKRVKNATALHYACMSSNAEMVKLVSQVSTNFTTEDYGDKAPIEYIDCSSDEGMAALKVYSDAFETWQQKRTVFDKVTLAVAAEAIFKRDLDLFETLLRRAPTVAVEQDGWTLLHVAVMNQLLPFIEHIIRVDASCLNIPGKSISACSKYVIARGQSFVFVSGATALHIACLVGNLEIAEVLLKAGADRTIKDSSKRTPEDYIRDAHGSYHVNILRRLCEEEDARRKAKAAASPPPPPIQNIKPAAEDTPAKKEESVKDAPKDKEAPKNAPDTSGSTTPRSDSSISESESDKSEMDVKKDDNMPASRALDLERIIGAKIIGQRGPVRSVASAMRLRENGWIDPDRPLVMLFLGSSGVGKTELAKQIALYIHGKSGADLDAGQSITELESEFKFVRIDMSEYQHKHTVSNLTGPPKGYVGYDEEGFLTRRLRKSPRAIVLLDEIEKAHPDVLTVFLQVFDDGRITDTKRGVIYCQNAVFIMTSNLASDEIKAASPMLRKLVEQTEDRPEEYTRVVGKFNRGIHPVLKQSLRRDEFLGRINQIVVFLPLNEDEISIVINKELMTWKKRSEEKHGINLTWSAEVVKKLTRSYDINFGVRSVVHEVQRIAVQQVAEAQIRGILKKNYLAYLTTNELGDIELKGEPREGHVRGRRGCRFHLH